MRHLFVMMLSFIVSINAMADNTNVVVERTDGNQTTFAFADRPVVTFKTEQLTEYMVITTSKEEVSYPMSSVKRFVFEGTATGISDLVIESKDAFTQGVEIYDMSGKLVRRSDGTGTVSVSTENLPAGVYVIKSGSETFKILKK